MIVVKVNWSAGNIKINGNDGQPRQNFCIITLGPPEVTNKYAPLFCNIISSDVIPLTFYYTSQSYVLNFLFYLFIR